MNIWVKLIENEISTSMMLSYFYLIVKGIQDKI